MATRPKPVSRHRHRNSYEMADPRSSPYGVKNESAVPPHRNNSLPLHHGKKVTKGVRAEGESGRKGIHPLKFFAICFRSSCTLSMIVNVLWPFVPAAFAVHYKIKGDNIWKFVLPYIAMVPSANLLGFAGQELARKLPHVFGVVLETTFGSVVELILLLVLIRRDQFQVARAAILGSILANMLLCLGLCFFAGGLREKEQEFHEAVSDVGSNLMLVAGMALVLPSIFYNAKYDPQFPDDLNNKLLKISRGTSVILIVAYVTYVFFQTRSHHGLYEDILQGDSNKDNDRHKDLYKAKLTLTEALIAVTVAITFVTFMAIYLVEEIEYMVEEKHLKDAFVGLILVPLVEKAAEHITAVDEAWDNQMNFALSHVLGSSVQTALLNTPLAVIVAWGLNRNFDLTFEIYDSAVLILAILVVGGFLRDGKSNYLEGALCVFVYIIIAISAFYFPNPPGHGSDSSQGHGTTSGSESGGH